MQNLLMKKPVKKKIDGFLEKYARISFDIKYTDVFNAIHEKSYDFLLYPIAVNHRNNRIQLSADIVERSANNNRKIIEYWLLDSESSFSNHRIDI